MKMRNGFTLIELLAVVVILGLIMMIAIPNTVSLIDKNKRSNYIENAKAFVSLVQSKVETDKSLEVPVNSSTALIVTLGYLNTSDIEENPYGEEYDKDNSFVAVMIESNKVVYYVHLISCTSKTNCDSANYNNYRGINLVELSRLNSDSRFSLVQSSGVEANLIEKLSSNSKFSDKTLYLNNRVYN